MSKEVLKLCMGKGFLLDKEMSNVLSGFEERVVCVFVDAISNLNSSERVVTKKIILKDIEKFRAFVLAKGESVNLKIFLESLGYSTLVGEENKVLSVEEKEEFGKVKLLCAPAFKERKIGVQDFVNHFRFRYEAIKSILEKREFDNLSSIRKIGGNHGSYTIIVSVLSKRMTKNKNLFLEVEDMTGNSIVLINQNKKDVFDKACELLEDDIVAFNVSGTSEMLFANDVIFPDAVLEEKRYGEKEEIVAFTGDFHIGSTMFLEKNLLKFVKWINGEVGDNEQKALALKVRYLFLTGDNIDGVNHYPGQEKYLIEDTSVGQYSKLEEILRLIRSDVQIIICPGQHDSVWVGEPQPIIGERFAEGLHKMKNVHLVPNPAFLELDFGFKILMYHGASINQFIDEIPEIRTNFGHKNPTRVVREMLKRRHLAPIHGGMDYIPCEKEDPMVIKEVPDILVTGDQHRPEIGIYNNILMIAGSCWQSITPFEEKVGNIPDPCKVPLFNLKTREIKILDFSDEPKEIEWEDSNELFCSMKNCPTDKECLVEKDCLEVSR